ncbi:MAG TPA: SURF1 family protein [Steroidobacteraceae bacterium]|nr:SURF1 family protein [Steroidobacteraceae bacterium]
MKIGSRIFAPRPFTTVLTLLILVMLVALGRWQLRRADQKRALYDAFDQGTDATRVIDLQTPSLPRYQHIEARGNYDASRQILIDNMTNTGGGAGYFVITPFALAGGGWLLINRGWVPVGASRAALPIVAVSGDARTVHGRTDHLPSPGIQMGHPSELRSPFPAVANFPSHIQIERLLQGASWTGAADVVLLDADQPDGYVRQWQAPGFPPLRHLAYAVQWFGLAVALSIIYVATNLRPKP